MPNRSSRSAVRRRAGRLLCCGLSAALAGCSSGRISGEPRAAAGSDGGALDPIPDAASATRDAALDAGSIRPRQLDCETWPRPSSHAAGLPASSADAQDDADAGPATDPLLALTDEPIVGATTGNTATFWVRAVSEADWAVRVWPRAAPEQARRIFGPTLTRDSDYVGVLEVAGLRPSTAYAYRIELGAPGAGLSSLDGRGGEFRTLAPLGARGKLRIVLGADIGTQPKQPIFDQIRETDPDLLLLLGDNVYADRIGVDFPSYAQAYVEGWQIRNLAALLSNVPSLMIWDDHEIVDNFAPGLSDRYAPARRAYELFVNSRNPAPARAGALYYTFDAADVSFFVLDERSHRSPEDQPDGPDKSMLGAEQKRALLAWLACSPARLKVIVSSVTFSDWSTSGNDSWAGYTSEREEIFSYIAAQAIDDVLLVSGDQHWSALFRYARLHYRFYEFMPTPLSKATRYARAEATPEILARDEDHFVFGVLDIDTEPTPAHLDITLCAAGAPCDPGHEPEPTSGLNLHGPQDDVPFTVHLTADDLGVSAMP
jgi:alkaline phosphatase D